NEHVSRLSLSVIETCDFDSNDIETRSKLMLNPVVRSLNSILSMYVDFIETFVKEVDIANGDQNHQVVSKTSVPNIQRMILLKSLIRILDYPLKYMDLTNLDIKEIKSQCNDINSGHMVPNLLDDEFISSRTIAIKVIKLISCL